MGQFGQMALSIGGTAIGSYLGGPVGGAIGGMIGGVAGSFLFRTRRPLITDLQSANSTYGNPIPILYGTARLPGTMIWQTQIQTKSAGFGKGGSGNPYNYFQSAALAFCEGPAQFAKIWLDGNLFWDGTSPIPHEITKKRFMIRGYTGTSTQLPDYEIASWCNDYVDVGMAGTPAYRDIAYMVMDKVNLDYYGNRFPQVTCAMTANGEATTFFHQSTVLSPDVSTTVDVISLANDWLRGLVYQLSSDGTLRVYSTTTYKCILAKTKAQLLSGGALVLAEDTTPAATAVLLGVVCGAGGYVYVWTGYAGTPTSTIYMFDPDTLTMVKAMTVPLTGIQTLWTLGCWSGPTSTSGGSGDTLVGSLYENPNYFAVIIDPDAYVDPLLEPAAIPLWYYPVPVTFGSGSGNGFSTFATGVPDPLSGQTMVYFLNTSSVASFNDTPQYLSSFMVLGAVVYQAYPGQVIKAETFGLAPPTTGGFTTPMPMLVDPIDGNVVFFNVPWYPSAQQPVAVKLDPTTMAIIWTATNCPFLGSESIMGCDVLAGTFAAFQFIQNPDLSYSVPILNMETGTFTYSPVAAADASTFGVNGHAYSISHSYFYNSQSDAIVYVASALPVVAKLNGVTSSDVTLASILVDLCGRVGVTADQVDVTRLTTTVTGYVLRDNKSAGAAIAELCNVYLVDMVESDYMLRFVPRAAASAATITQAQLGSTDPSDPSHFWMARTAQEQEMPLQVNLKYSDPALDYQPGSAYFRRTALPVPTVYSKRKMTMDIPVVTDNLTATGLAAAMLYSIWGSRETYDTVLSPEFLWLDPTDNITVNLDNGDSYTVRIESIQAGADMSLQLHVAAEDISIYAPITTKGVTYGNGAQTLTVSGFASLLQLNVPLLQDSDAAAAGASRIYYAAAASAVGWGGGTVYKSTDGVNWVNVGVLASGSNYGSALTALPDVVAKFCTDTVNSVRIGFGPGSTLPSSCAYADLMNGSNGALLGQEVIQFQTVVDNADGTVTLSGLIRGQRGTEWATGLHVVGDVFLLLQSGQVAANVVTTAEIGTPEIWQLVPRGLSNSQALTRSFIPLGYDLFPYAPVQFVRAPSGSDLAVTWVRRTRIGGTLVDGSDTAPLNEDTEAYDAYVLPSAAALASFNPASSLTYTRAFIGLTSAGLTYTAAQMTADSFTPATGTLYLVVYQLSGVVGRGFQGYQALPAF